MNNKYDAVFTCLTAVLSNSQLDFYVTVNNVWLGISVYVEFSNPVKCDMAFAMFMQLTYCDVVHMVMP